MQLYPDKQRTDLWTFHWYANLKKGSRVGAHDYSIVEFWHDINQVIEDGLISLLFTIEHTHWKLEVSHLSAKTSSHPIAEKLEGML